MITQPKYKRGRAFGQLQLAASKPFASMIWPVADSVDAGRGIEPKGCSSRRLHLEPAECSTVAIGGDPLRKDALYGGLAVGGLAQLAKFHCGDRIVSVGVFADRSLCLGEHNDVSRCSIERTDPGFVAILLE